MKKNFMLSEIDQNIAVVDDGLSNGGIFLDDFVYGGSGSEFIMPIDKIPSGTGFPTSFDVNPNLEVPKVQSGCTVYQNQSDADWMGDYQMCDGTWQYGGNIGAGASVCLVSGTAFTLSGMDLVPLYPCDVAGNPTSPIENPVESPVENKPIYAEPTPETTFVDDSKFPVGTEIATKIVEKMPEINEAPIVTETPHPIDQFISGNSTTTPPMASPMASTMATPTEPTAAAASVAKPIAKPIGKNLTPYIYAGIGIIVILVVARMVTKK